MEEQWAKIPNHDYYEVSNYGRVRSLDRTYLDKNGKVYHKKGKMLRPNDKGGGYRRVQLKDGVYETVYVHRLVAQAFIPNPGNKPCVNHIDNNPNNNHVSNLEWVTKQENTDWMAKQGRNKRTSEWLSKMYDSQKKFYKAVCGTNTVTGERIYFDHLNAVKEQGFSPSSVCACCRKYPGVTEYRGYKWEYVNGVQAERKRNVHK